MMRARRYRLALDQGGHASRAVLFDAAGNPAARALVEVREHRPRRGWVEQDPEEVVRSLKQVAARVLERAEPGAAILAGLATQRSSVVCWDAGTGEAVSPVLSWQDRRAHRRLRRLATFGDTVHEKTGLYLTGHYGATKLRWCLERLPEVRRARKQGRLRMGPLAAFLAHRLLRERSSKVDPANAARTLLFNVHAADWDPELLQIFRVPRDVLPQCVPTCHAFGHLATPREVPMTVLTGDQSAALFAFGRPEQDVAYVNLGTGAFVQRAAERLPQQLDGLLGSLVFSGEGEKIFAVEGTVNGASSALRKVAAALGVADYEPRLHDWLLDEAPREPPLFLNGISGLGSPYWMADFRSRFVGRGRARDKLVAVVESIVFLLAINLEQIVRCSGPLRRIVVTGGLSWYDGLCRRLATLCGIPVERPEDHEATTRGLATLLAPDAPAFAGSFETFYPEDRPAWLGRYRRWREAMLEAVEAHRAGRRPGALGAPPEEKPR